MTTQNKKTIQLDPQDNVAVALVELAPETALDGSGLCSRQKIPAGHKIATRRIEAGEPIIKYGQIIGFASKKICEGEHVHTHNVELKSFKREWEITEDSRPTRFVSEKDRAVFEGIVRSDGQVGTRNYVGILSTVSCSAGVADLIAEAAGKDISTEDDGLDGILAVGHGEGCCMTPGGEGLEMLQRAVAEAEQDLEIALRQIDEYQYTLAAQRLTIASDERKYAFDIKPDLMKKYEETIQKNQEILQIIQDLSSLNIVE